MLFRVYMTDGIRALTDSISGALGGSSLSKRWYEQIDNKKIESAEQIKNRIKGKLAQ